MNTNYLTVGLGVIVIIIMVVLYMKPWDNLDNTDDDIFYDLKITTEEVSIDSLQINGKPLPKGRNLYGISGSKVGTVGQLESGEFSQGRVYIRRNDLQRPAQKENEISFVIRSINSDSPFFHASVMHHLGETNDGVNIQQISLDSVRLESKDFENINLPHEINLTP